MIDNQINVHHQQLVYGNKIAHLEATCWKLSLLISCLSERKDIQINENDTNKYKDNVYKMIGRLKEKSPTITCDIRTLNKCHSGDANSLQIALCTCQSLLLVYSELLKYGVYDVEISCSLDRNTLTVIGKANEIFGYWMRKLEINNINKWRSAKSVEDRRKENQDAIKDIMIKSGVYEWPDLSGFRKEKEIRETFVRMAKGMTKTRKKGIGLSEERIFSLAREILADKKRSTV